MVERHTELKVEGILEKILRVIVNQDKSGQVTKVTTIIAIMEGEDQYTPKLIHFKGLIFPDSIGHKVSYRAYNHETPKDDPETYVCYAEREELVDLKIGRTYTTELNCFSSDNLINSTH